MRTWGRAAGGGCERVCILFLYYNPPTQTYYFITELCILDFPTSLPSLLVTWSLVDISTRVFNAQLDPGSCQSSQRSPTPHSRIRGDAPLEKPPGQALWDSIF